MPKLYLLSLENGGEIAINPEHVAAVESIESAEDGQDRWRILLSAVAVEETEDDLIVRGSIERIARMLGMTIEDR